MTISSLIDRVTTAHHVRADYRALERALSRAVSAEARHELIVLDAIRH